MPKPISVINILYSLISSVLLISCADTKDYNKKIQEALKNSLDLSNELIEVSSALTLKDLEEKKYEFETRERAEIWWGKANLIKKFSEIRFDFIEKKKKKQKLNSNDIKEIFENLIEYKKEILGRDSSLKEKFYNEFGFINKYKSLLVADSSSNSFSIQKKLPPELIKSILIALQSEIRKIENRTILFCNNRVGMFDGPGFFQSYSAIIGQNTNILKPGDILEINAGIGAFSFASQPIITFSGKKKDLTEYGYSIYRINAPKKPGNYTIPVKISFLNKITGKSESLQRNVEYTVAEPCNN